MTFQASTSRSVSTQDQSISDRVANATREAAVVTQALAAREIERPLNTRKAYLSKQRMFEVT